MPSRKSNRKRLLIDGKPYVYWVRQLHYDDTGGVPLSVVVRAEFGTRSICTFSGLVNRERWHDYPEWNQESVIAVTPKVICDLVQHAHRAGWKPSNIRSNLTLEIDNSFLSRPSGSETGDNDERASGQ